MIRLLLAILFVLAAFTTAPANASGKLTLQNNFQNGGKDYRPMVGFGIYEPITSLAHLNAWTGYGKVSLEDTEDVNWFVAKAQVDLHIFNKFTLAPGVQWRTIDSDHTDSRRDTTVYARIDYQLW